MKPCTPFWKLHAWKPWVASRRVVVWTQVVILGVNMGDPYESGCATYQERECGRCGKQQLRRVSAGVE